MKFTLSLAIAAGLFYLCPLMPARADYSPLATAIPQSPVTGKQLAILSEAIASPPILAWKRETIPVAACSIPPVIDGNLDDPCWAGATHHAGMYPVGSVTPIDSADQTEVWICADQTHLYIAFHCLQRHQTDIRADEVTRNGDLSHDDFVGVDIDSHNSHHGFSTFEVNARGTQWVSIEGGTPENLKWVGDWTAATKLIPGGWTTEISIPFSLLRYENGAKEFGIDLYRSVSHNTTIQCWPYLPPEGVTTVTEGQYLSRFTGMTPLQVSAKPTYLAYALGSAGQRNSFARGPSSAAKEGLDIKYPLTTTLTAIGTIRPDFRDVEQDVTNVNFSYTQKFIPDHRPFFAEGSAFLPDGELFNPGNRIALIDAGIKVIGKQGNTSIGFLDAENRSSTQLAATQGTVLDLTQDLGLYSNARFIYIKDSNVGFPNNSVQSYQGTYGWQANRTRYAFHAEHTPSFWGNQQKDSRDVFSFGTTPVYGRPSFAISHTDMGKNYINDLGFVPEVDLKGDNFQIAQYNQFDRGWIQNYNVSIGANTYQHHTGGFYRNDGNVSAGIFTRKGLYYALSYDVSQRITPNFVVGGFDHFHDHVTSATINWGQKTSYQQGGVQDSFGEQAANTYNFLNIYQNILLSRSLYINIDFNRLLFGSTITTQTVSGFTYRISDVDTIGGRAVSSGSDTNFFMSYGHHVRTGNDIYLIFGDPDTARTDSSITAKVVHAL